MNNNLYLKWVLELTNQEYAGNIQECLDKIKNKKE
jgi:hypothetical protein